MGDLRADFWGTDQSPWSLELQGATPRRGPGPVARTWGPPWLLQTPSVPRRESCLLVGHVC